MLTIDRKINQSVYINDLEIKLVNIKSRLISLKIGDGEIVDLKQGQRTYIQSVDTEILFSSQFRRGVQLAFDAGRDTTILRKEIYKKNNSYSKYISRELNQSLYVGDIAIEVVDIKKNDNSVILKVDNEKTIRLHNNESVIVNGIKVYCSEILSDSEAMIAFYIDKDISVMKEERYYGDGNQIDIDNSTKQFPSGGNY